MKMFGIVLAVILRKKRGWGMDRNRLILIIGLTVIFLGGAGYIVWDFVQTKILEYKIKEALENNERFVWNEWTEIKPGEEAPDFQLETLNGDVFRLSDYRGKVVVLNFWATWCPPCQEEMPHLQNFYEKNKERPVAVVAINLTSQDSGMAEIEQFVQDFGLTFPIPLDHDGEVGMQYATFAIPTNYIIDVDGIIVHKHPGPLDEQLLREFTDPLLQDE